MKSKPARFLGMTMLKFEDLGVTVDGVPVDIKPANMIGFLPVFESEAQAEAAGWDGDKVIGVRGGSLDD
ncbi:MAG: hypothetical protein R8M45_07270 [Ghiorsea sp.]